MTRADAKANSSIASSDSRVATFAAAVAEQVAQALPHDRVRGRIGAGESESEHAIERRHEAIAAVRLVNKEGDVIWSTTQESLDLAEKITGKLKEDFEKARKLR